eukprot:2445224-Alexandrium_andersonii.AAC.1
MLLDNHAAGAISLRRVGVPRAFTSITMALYREPEFRVKQHVLNSAWKRQGSRTRQACPLLPYLQRS